MKNFLKYINSIPFRFTMRHYQNFGGSALKLKDNSLNFVESWDNLRAEHPHFSIPKVRAEWLETAELKVVKDGQDKGLVERAKNIARVLKRENINTVFSVGVGGAGLEYHIKKNLPGVKVFCSEYSEQNVEALKGVFVECDGVVRFDILKGDWAQIKNTYLLDKSATLLVYRIDASFTDTEWRQIFENIYASGISNVVYIPTTLLSLLSVWNRKQRELLWFLKNNKISFAGHLRTKKTFQSFWAGLYGEEEYVFGGLKGFLLKKIEE